MKRLFFITLILIACKKGTSQEYDLALYGIFGKYHSDADTRVLVAFYDVKNSQIISDASIYLKDKKLTYQHPFYILDDYPYNPNQVYTLKILYNDFSEEINFKTIETPDSFSVSPTSGSIPLYQDLVIRWKLDSVYHRTHDYYTILFFENKSKNPSLVYSAGPLGKDIDSVVIPGYYIETRNAIYQVTICFVNFTVLDKFKPYPGYEYSFIATGQLVVFQLYTEP